MRLAKQLYTTHYDTVLLFHHLSTRFGALKYAAFCAATAAPQRLGLDNGRGWFLTHTVHDEGYGARHEMDYALAIARLLVPDARRPAPIFPVFEIEHARALQLLEGVVGNGPLIALHPGSGGYAPVRRWPVARYATLADTMIERGATIVLVGGKEEAELRRSLLTQMHYASKVLDLGGSTTLGELVAVLGQCAIIRRQRRRHHAPRGDGGDSGCRAVWSDRSTYLGSVEYGAMGNQQALPEWRRGTPRRSSYHPQSRASMQPMYLSWHWPRNASRMSRPHLPQPHHR